MRAKTGVIIVGHGSRSDKGREMFAEMTERFAERYPTYEVTHAFLELQKPSFEEALDTLYNKQVRDIVVLPAFLFTGVHVSHDIPLEFRELREKYPDAQVRMASYIGASIPVVEIIQKRILEVRRESITSEDEQQAILLVGVGASVKDANADFKELCDFLVKTTELPRVAHAFISGMAPPEYEEQLRMLAKSDAKEIFVIPALLFPGMYLQRIQEIAEVHAKEYNKHIHVSEILGLDVLLLEGLYTRLLEVTMGEVDLISELPEEIERRREF